MIKTYITLAVDNVDELHKYLAGDEGKKVKGPNEQKWKERAEPTLRKFMEAIWTHLVEDCKELWDEAASIPDLRMAMKFNAVVACLHNLFVLAEWNMSIGTCDDGMS